SFCRPATTWSQPDGLAHAPWTRTMVGRSPAARTGFATADAASIENRSNIEAAIAIARDHQTRGGPAAVAVAMVDTEFIASPSCSFDGWRQAPGSGPADA